MKLKQWQESMSDEQLQNLRLSLYKYCLSLTRSTQDAEDLTQEALLKVAARFERYGQHANPEALLLRIAKNTWIDSLRRSASYGKVLQREQNQVEDAGQDQEQSGKQKLEAAFFVMMKYLSPMQRTVLLLREVLGYSAAECAESLKTTEGAVKALLYRARQALIPARMRGVDFYEEQAIVQEEGRMPDFRPLVEAYEQGDIHKLINLVRWGGEEFTSIDAVSRTYVHPLDKVMSSSSYNGNSQMVMSLAS